MVLPKNVTAKSALRLFLRPDVCNDGAVRRPKEVVMSRFNDNEFVPDDDVDDYDDLDDYDELSDDDDYGDDGDDDYDDDDYDDDLEDASEDEIDFVVALYNDDGERVAVPMEPMLANDFDELITQLRRLPGDAGAVGMVSIDHQFYVIVRVRGRNVQVLSLIHI